VSAVWATGRHELYVRSGRGTDGSRYCAEQARATTVRLVPADDDERR
jgi:hypothetical protein